MHFIWKILIVLTLVLAVFAFTCAAKDMYNWKDIPKGSPLLKGGPAKA